jgi:SMC interacting uncharacterized protein involved in chromosome segregation
MGEEILKEILNQLREISSILNRIESRLYELDSIMKRMDYYLSQVRDDVDNIRNKIK